MNQKYIIIGVAVFVAFVAGLIYLARIDATIPSGSEAKFISYAQEIGIDVEQFKLDIVSQEVEDRVKSDQSEARSRNVNATPTFFANGQQIQLPNTVAEMKTTLDGIAQQSDAQEIPEGVHVKGSQNPKVLLEEFSDIECPACGAYAPTIKKFFEEHPDSEVALVYKHFPLSSIHFYAEAAAKATEAAALQGKFWEMHDILFEKQAEWSR